MMLVGLAGWMNRKQQGVIEYLQTENEVLKEELNKSGRKLNDSRDVGWRRKARRSGAKGFKNTPVW
tara:strand:+ start:287 stop:484 length:198 start_codon:yes stop_codon:yes gene_type:complete